jgi:NAD(P)-dependent dehydrogenase (short-subunit alcohol dehydrogenase family)
LTKHWGTTLGRHGRPAQIAAMVRFPVGCERRYITGQTDEASSHDH